MLHCWCYFWDTSSWAALVGGVLGFARRTFFGLTNQS